MGLGNIVLTISYPGLNPESPLGLLCKGSLSNHRSRHLISEDVSKVKSWKNLGLKKKIISKSIPCLGKGTSNPDLN